jgi:hypothetical protein
MTSQPKPDLDALANEVAQGIAAVRQVLAPIDEAVRGYRHQLEQEGWSATAAERMALELHRAMMRNVTAGAS